MITPIITNNIFYRNVNNKQCLSNDFRPLSLKQTQSVDTVSFTGAKNSGALKKLLDYGIPDMYSGKIMLSTNKFQELLDGRIFSMPLREIVKALKPHEDCFTPVPEQIFKIIKKYSKINPKQYLDDVIRNIAPLHLNKLVERQKPILKELEKQALDMPEKQYKAFTELMEITNKKLENKMVVIPFSRKEFIYKLERIKETCINSKNVNDNAAIERLLNVAKRFIEEKDLNNKTLGNPNKNLKHKLASIKRRNISTLKEFENTLYFSSLNNNKEIKELITTNRAKIFHIPMMSPFKRKPFIHDLKKITNTLSDTKLAHKMVQTAIKLPTSEQDVSAFIVKAAECSNEKIGFDMLYPSVGSAEHLLPASKGGINDINNYALASRYTNTERSNTSFARQLELHPETYDNCQKQVDRLIVLCNKGIFKRIGLPKHYITTLAKNLYKLSPSDKPLILDVSKLKN